MFGGQGLREVSGEVGSSMSVAKSEEPVPGVSEGVREEWVNRRVWLIVAAVVVVVVAVVVETCRLMERVTVCEADWRRRLAKWRGSLSEAILM